jgi:hypothetical protein
MSTMTPMRCANRAHSIADHVQSTNWKIKRGPPTEGHGQYIIPPRGE